MKLHPYRQQSIFKFAHPSAKFTGLYKILKIISDVAYQLTSPSDAQIHGIFHVSLLKPALGRNEKADDDLHH